MKQVLVIILNYKTYEMTINLIQQLKKLDESLFDILVVDNCSPNESAKVLLEHSGKLNYVFISNQENAGYAAGNNIGIRYAIQQGYAYSMIMNNDLEIVDSQLLEKLIQIGNANDNIACIGPKVLDIDHHPVAPYCDRPSLYSLTLGIIQEKKRRSKYIDISRPVYRVYGCCMLLKNSAMQEVDCMDERTFLYCEEDILAERLLAKGYIAYYNADASILHMESATVKQEHSGKNLQKMKIAQNSMRLYLREYRHFNIVQLRFYQGMRWLMWLLRG